MNWLYQSITTSNLPERSMKTINKTNDPKITITQFNILPEVNMKNPHYYTKWSYRSDKIKREILSNKPDIICLEGVDHFKDFFYPHLSTQGYFGYTIEKASHDGKQKGGCALFLKKNRFQLLDIRAEYFSDELYPEVYLLTKITMFESTFIVGVTHLKGKPENQKIRIKQAKAFLKAIEEFNDEGLPVIICGDLNDSMNSDTYKEFKKFNNLESAYSFYEKNRKEPYTTLSIDTDGNRFKECHDYIFYSGDSLSVSKLLSIPNSSIFGENIPAPNYPSDHLSITSELYFKKTKTLINLNDRIEKSKKKMKMNLEELEDDLKEITDISNKNNEEIIKMKENLKLKDLKIDQMTNELNDQLADISKLRGERDANIDQSGNFSHLSLSKKYGVLQKNKFFAASLLKLFKKKQRRELQSEFIKMMIDSIEDHIQNIIEKSKKSLIFNLETNEIELEILSLWLKDKNALEDVSEILKILSDKYKSKCKDDTFLKEKVVTQIVKDTICILISMKLGKPKGQFKFFDSGVDFNSEYHDKLQDHKASGKIIRTIAPAYIVIDGFTDEEIYKTRAIVETKPEPDSSSEENEE